MAERKRRQFKTKRTYSRPILIGVRVPKAFHRRVMLECVSQDVSLQGLLMKALESYFEKPVADSNRANGNPSQGDPGLSDTANQEIKTWMTLWERYATQMPREKIDVMTSAMEWDLLMQKSSRRKITNKGLADGRSGGQS
jgi:hypothetical protein